MLAKKYQIIPVIAAIGALLICANANSAPSLKSHIESTGVSSRALAQIEELSKLFEQIYIPARGAAAIEARIRKIEASCATLAKPDSSKFNECRKSKGGSELDQMLVALRRDGNACNKAALKYQEYLFQCQLFCQTRNNEVFTSFDEYCLASNVAWQHSDGTFRADIEPIVFHTGGEHRGLSGILNAVVLIEFERNGLREHICGGLLLSGNRVLTARHCVLTPLIQNAIKDGKVFVRTIRGDSGDGWALEALPSTLSSNTKPAMDYIVLTFKSAGLIAAPLVSFVEPTLPSPAIVLGYFQHYDIYRKLPIPSNETSVIPNWKRGMRWPKSGLCHVIEARSGCVRTLCQTIEGYSGTPVFSDKTSADGKLLVYGVISGADYANAQCGTFDSLTTLVASPSDIEP